MKKLKLHHRLFIFAAIMYVGGAIAFIVMQYVVEREKLVSSIDKELLMTIDAASYILPSDYGDRAVTADAIGEEEYNEIRDMLTKYAMEYEIQYLYAMYRAENGVIYEIATSSEVADETEFFYFKESGEMFEGRIGELEFLFNPSPDEDPVYVEDYEQGLLTYNRVVCKRYFASGGTPYVLCADSDMDVVQGKLRFYILRQIGYLIFLLLLVVPLLIAYRIKGKYKEEELNNLVRQRTEELYFALQEANRLNKAKSDFLANMSHELRTPLNAIIGFSEVIMMGSLPEKTMEYSKAINESGQHLLTLINDVLDYSKVEANKYSLNEEKIDVPSLLDGVKEVISGYKNAAEKNISYNVDGNVPKLFADARIVKQVLLNIMSNAVKFTDKEESHISLDAKYNSKTKEISFSISDNGSGISEENQKNIFEPFKQSSNGMNKKHEGTGLGLALVQRFLEMHGAKISLESTVGEGSTFNIVFPASRSV
ncbi:MAG: HAMP domain-containing histidine kinase [Lactobacillus sp.]|jgi:signal transduction histidine kinase|nr:HAMP domain-containing histidine kinase [Lactobacillus sp.]